MVGLRGDEDDEKELSDFCGIFNFGSSPFFSRLSSSETEEDSLSINKIGKKCKHITYSSFYCKQKNNTSWVTFLN